MPTVQIRPNVPHHFLLITRPTPAHCVALHILIQILIGIQLRAIAREIRDLDSILMLLEPLLHVGRDMNGMLVNNQWLMESEIEEEILIQEQIERGVAIFMYLLQPYLLAAKPRRKS